VNNGDVAVPALTPLRYSVYPATPTLSVDAAHEVAIDVVPLVPTENEAGAEGAVTSGQAEVDAVIEVRSETLPAASNASTPSV
jgi:hypothetical protein